MQPFAPVVDHGSDCTNHWMNASQTFSAQALRVKEVGTTEKFENPTVIADFAIPLEFLLDLRLRHY
jgi:hypothetical protein